MKLATLQAADRIHWRPGEPVSPLTAMWNVTVTRQDEQLYQASQNSLLLLLNRAGKVIRQARHPGATRTEGMSKTATKCPGEPKIPANGSSGPRS
jgi:hypothetical protein